MSNSTALQKIEAAEKTGAMICFDKNNFFPQVELYKTEVTEMTINKDDDCFCISKKYMPKKEVVDRIGEAAGVIFTLGNTQTQTLEDEMCGRRTVYIASAQGKIRMPDGTWRMSSICDYEFDPVLRAMTDYDVTELNSETKQKRKTWTENGVSKPYGNTLAVAILEYQKMARQRANTGARLRVIRELVGMPISFTSEQLKKPIYFGRIVQNTSYILQTPAGQALATAQALGADITKLFGNRTMIDAPSAHQEMTTGDVPPPSSNVTPPPASEAENLATQATSSEPDFPDEPTGPGTQQEETEFDRLGFKIDQLLTCYKKELNVVTDSGKNPFKMAEEELKSSASNEESRTSMYNRLITFLKRKGIDV